MTAVKIQVQNYTVDLKFGPADLSWNKEQITDDVSVVFHTD
jgi:hypothetical protein